MSEQISDEIMWVRGVPIQTVEVFTKQEELGAQLFDECVFKGSLERRACASVILTLDRALKIYLEKRDLRRLPEQEIIVIDIGDPSWKYVPIKLFPQDGFAISFPTRESPAGKVAWFRYRKVHTTRKLNVH